MIGYSQQELDQDDIDSVIAVLKSTNLTQGPSVQRFASALGAYVGAEHVVLTNSGTSALHIACLALGIGKNDIVWTTPISFVASANCALFCGAEVDFVDVDSNFISMCPQALASKLKQAKAENQLPKALVVVDYAGQVGHLQQLYQLATEYGVKVIEDACHALGGQYQNQKTGSCQYSDITIFSFHPVKSITTAEGGALVTQDEQIARKARKYASHGITKQGVIDQDALQNPWYYEQQTLGFNYRMSDLHAALGLTQLVKLDRFIESRQHAAQFYRLAFEKAQVHLRPNEQVKVLAQNPESKSANHLFPIYLPNASDVMRRHVMAALREAGYMSQVHYIPISSQPYYQALGFKTEHFPNALAFYQSCLSIPLFPSITKTQQQHIVDIVLDACLEQF
jgi:UDP-4-amino-4,6-dideoxy-N-acetyl-beta-L-altrosamine transaminase